MRLQGRPDGSDCRRSNQKNSPVSRRAVDAGAGYSTDRHTLVLEGWQAGGGPVL